MDPEKLIRMATARDRRFVRNGGELLDTIQESLARYQAALHGPEHQIDEIWNTPRKGKKRIYRPKDELEFCRSVHRHFLHDLVDRNLIVNREVELHLGERTDIHVNAIDSRTGGSFTAVIEAKGCWHSKLTAAMETQLADRYLGDGAVCHGLYLVGWFLCDVWDAEDDRRDATSKVGWDIVAAREELAKQACELAKTRTKDIRAVVLDATWPSSPAKASDDNGAVSRRKVAAKS